MASRLFRVSVFAATSVAAIGAFALVHAAPATPRHPAKPAYQVAAMGRRGSGESLADDAAAAGETGHARPDAPPPRFSTPAQASDPIGAMIAAAPPSAPADIFDAPYPRTEATRPQRHRHVPPPHHAVARAAPHHAVQLPAASPARAPTPRIVVNPAATPQAAPVRPHRLHIVVQPPVRQTLTPAPVAAPVDAALPEVQAGRPPIIDLDARLAELTATAAADMSGADFELSPDLSAGREGAVVVRLPERLVSDLEAKAEQSGFDLDAHPLSVSVALSARGYEVTPQQTLTSQIQPGRAAAFSWNVRPSGASGGTLSATLTASLQADGEPVNAPLGALTAQIPAPAPIVAPPDPYAAPSPVLAPAPDLGERLRHELARLGLGPLSRLSLHDLSIPGRPTLNVPLLGEVASEKVVAAGLLLLLLWFLRSLLHGSSVRAERRRRFEAYDRDYFGHEAR